VKQCVDPKLNNDYPPKAIAKVHFFVSLNLIFDESVPERTYENSLRHV